MKISGFTMGKNTSKLYYPVKESIESILPLVDEFIVVLGDSDTDDTTRELIESIGSDKIKIIDTVWDIVKYSRGTEHAHQTDIAKEACSGNWLFYLQADEIVHEDDIETIRKRCEELLDDKEVEGLLFNYRHFWGDYDHYHNSHGWYAHEIRIVRNDPEIHSFESAQSFRRIPGFDYVDYRMQEGTHKLKVASVDAYIYHYGWVRPPAYMQNKRQAFDGNHKGVGKSKEMHQNVPKEFDYGPLQKLPVFKGTHPAVMMNKIKEFDWADKLQYSGKRNPYRKEAKHERLKYRIVTQLEQKLFGRPIFTFKNYELLKNK
ncbi:MAG: hypothetical protein KAH48_05375 [Chlorobi bacterium]|nr:hypothetical protein [Chlorobiota bacterium]